MKQSEAQRTFSPEVTNSYEGSSPGFQQGAGFLSAVLQQVVRASIHHLAFVIHLQTHSKSTPRLCFTLSTRSTLSHSLDSTAETFPLSAENPEQLSLIFMKVFVRMKVLTHCDITGFGLSRFCFINGVRDAAGAVCRGRSLFLTFILLSHRAEQRSAQRNISHQEAVYTS